MNTIGKILVGLAFVFSLVEGALILMVFYVSTNWYVGFRQLKGYYEVSQANVRTYQEEAIAIRSDSDKKLQQINGDLEKTKGELARADADKKKLNEEIETERSNVKRSLVSVETTTAELNRVREELKSEQAKVDERNKKIVELAKSNTDLRDKSIQSDIAAAAYKMRLDGQVKALQDAQRENAMIQQGKTPGRAAQAQRRPPPEDVRGIVKETDLRSGLITISIGSDAGISKGNSLYVYRLAPKPQYLGEIYILDVHANESVAQMVAARGGPMQIQRGDEVASNISGSR